MPCVSVSHGCRVAQPKPKEEGQLGQYHWPEPGDRSGESLCRTIIQLSLLTQLRPNMIHDAT